MSSLELHKNERKKARVLIKSMPRPKDYLEGAEKPIKLSSKKLSDPLHLNAKNQQQDQTHFTAGFYLQIMQDSSKQVLSFHSSTSPANSSCFFSPNLLNLFYLPQYSVLFSLQPSYSISSKPSHDFDGNPLLVDVFSVSSIVGSALVGERVAIGVIDGNDSGKDEILFHYPHVILV